MLYFPSAKINIGLNIVAKRSDGFHEIETVFFPVPLYDALEIISGKSVTGKDCSLRTYGLPIAGDIKDNLVLRAYHLLNNAYPGKMAPVSVILMKHIPMGAGLGGGSADGAFMLRLLNDYFQLNLSTSTLIKYATALGSDCAFFLQNKPCFATGTGSRLTPVALDLSTFCLQLVCPAIHCSTAEAYRAIRPRKPAFNGADVASLPVAEWKNYLVNDFEASVFQSYPELASIKQQLYEQGAIYAAMSGSGSAIYGLFPKGTAKARLKTSLPLQTFYLPLAQR